MPGRFRYDATGRLLSDINPLGGGWTLSRSRDDDANEAWLTSTLNRVHGERVESDGAIRTFIHTGPDGLTARTRIEADGSTESTAADGTRSRIEFVADPICSRGRVRSFFFLSKTPPLIL